MMGFEPTTFCMASGSWVQAGERREAQQRIESDLRLASGDLLTHLPSRLLESWGIASWPASCAVAFSD
jgi:hypothetical protein